MLGKVENLLNKPNSILQAPVSSGNSSFLVENDSKMEPHYVTIAEKCPNNLQRLSNVEGTKDLRDQFKLKPPPLCIGWRILK